MIPNTIQEALNEIKVDIKESYETDTEASFEEILKAAKIEQTIFSKLEHVTKRAQALGVPFEEFKKALEEVINNGNTTSDD
jgi:hypothetical protein